MNPVTRALGVATLWLSPAALLALGPALLADGTLGLWPPLVLGASAVVTALLVAEPWSRLPGPARGSIPACRQRWPAGDAALAPLAVGEAAAGLLFLWAQLAAGRELAASLGGWPRLTVVLLVVGLVAASGPARPRPWLVGAGGLLAALGLVLPLAAVTAVSTPWWPRVWREVASRPRVTFTDGSVWTTEGRPLRGSGPAGGTLTVDEEQRVTLAGRGRARVEPWGGAGAQRDVAGEAELTLRPRDRLTVSGGLVLRFQADRRIPGAPATGVDWIDPADRRGGHRASLVDLAGLAVTCLFGVLGQPGLAAALRGASRLTRPSLRLAATVVALGLGAATLWALYAAWLTPAIYAGGVAGVTVYELPGNLPALGPWGGPLRGLALGGLAAAGVSAALLALHGLPRSVPDRASGPRPVEAGVAAGAGLLALATPAAPWPVLLAALGLGAAACAPGAVLACWSERATARTVGLGAGIGLGLFGLLALAGLVTGRGAGPLDWVFAWPGLVALPANALVAWLAPAPAPTSPRSPLPEGLAGLHE